ncbi:MAG TPA: Gfo/Idh/MocA family oxidoreductase [Actinomycetota bacterium]|nr:Gfo/Idh/MocA family oxidoreductase [Actinomycetota bacterium]
MAERVRLAILGPGDVAQRDYLPEFERIADRAEIVAVCGRTEHRARALAEQHGASWFTDQATMLREVGIDAVLNLTPIQAHAETTAMALEAGVHVYSEKPLAGSVADGRDLERLAEERGLVLVAAPCVMRFPQVLLARQLIDAGRIGRVHTARGVVMGAVPPWPGFTSDPTPYFSPGAGPLVDLGVYPLHAITGLVAPVRRVSAMSARVGTSFTVPDGPAAGTRVDVNVDDTWVTQLDLGEGRLATVEANYSSHGTHAAELELMGTDGTLALSLLDVAAPIEVLTDGTWTSVEVPRTGRADGPDHLVGVEHLLDRLAGDAEPELTPAHAIHVLEIVEQAERSARDGVVASLETTIDR